MQIKAVQIERYRSISKAAIDLKNLTVLVGPNNEGKSNILQAIVMGMGTLRVFADPRIGASFQMPATPRPNMPVSFDWDQDFSLLHRDGKKQSTAVEFQFEFAEQDIEDFTDVIGSRINGLLRIRLTYDSKNRVTIRVVKQRSGTAWTKKAAEIAQFIGNRVLIEYVPAIRTAQESVKVVSRLVAEELRALESDPEYQEARETIRRLQAPRLTDIGDGITADLAHFLPDIKSVEITTPEVRQHFASGRDVRITIDDGVPTRLEAKGDGVQSLAAIALLRRAALDRTKNHRLVLAVEEPEAHLHPGAVRELALVLREIAGGQQVVVTTHSPVLADPLLVSSNVIVEGSRARPAKHISDVRECLGVEVQDNLYSAQMLLLVEGTTDLRIMRSTLSQFPQLRDLLQKGALSVESLGGASVLSSRISSLTAKVCGYFAFLDADQEGRAAVQRAQSKRLITSADFVLAKARGKTESETEDLIEPQVYVDGVNDLLRTSISARQIRSGRMKWTVRMKLLVEENGKVWSEDLEHDLKTLVADGVEASTSTAILTNASSVFENIIAGLMAPFETDSDS